MATKRDYEDYNEFLKKVGYGQLDGVDVTHDGFPLSVKEAKFIDMFIVTGEYPDGTKVDESQIYEEYAKGIYQDILNAENYEGDGD